MTQLHAELQSRIQEVLQEVREARGEAEEANTAAFDRFEAAIHDLMEHLVTTQALVQNILDSSTEYSIIGKDLERRIILWNEGARRNYGYTSAEVLGHSSDFLHAASDLESGLVKRMHREAMEHGKSEGRFTRIRKDGSSFPASVVITRREDAQGRAIGYLLISRDVSGEEEAERIRERERQAEFKTRFLNMAAHELLTPLTPVRTVLLVMGKEQVVREDEVLAKQVDVLRRNVDRLSQLVKDILDASQMDMDKQALELEDVDLAVVAGQTAASFDKEAQHNGILLETRLESAPVQGDRGRLAQVVEKLLSNAIKYTPGPGTVRITTSANGQKARLVVEDTGIGIPYPNEEDIFSAFSRTARHTSTFESGSGLGLYIAKRIVELHGGSMTVASAEGEGTRLALELPLKPPMPALGSR